MNSGEALGLTNPSLLENTEKFLTRNSEVTVESIIKDHDNQMDVVQTECPEVVRKIITVGKNVQNSDKVTFSENRINLSNALKVKQTAMTTTRVLNGVDTEIPILVANIDSITKMNTDEKEKVTNICENPENLSVFSDSQRNKHGVFEEKEALVDDAEIQSYNNLNPCDEESEYEICSEAEMNENENLDRETIIKSHIHPVQLKTLNVEPKVSHENVIISKEKVEDTGLLNAKPKEKNLPFLVEAEKQLNVKHKGEMIVDVLTRTEICHSEQKSISSSISDLPLENIGEVKKTPESFSDEIQSLKSEKNLSDDFISDAKTSTDASFRVTSLSYVNIKNERKDITDKVLSNPKFGRIDSQTTVKEKYLVSEENQSYVFMNEVTNIKMDNSIKPNLSELTISKQSEHEASNCCSSNIELLEAENVSGDFAEDMLLKDDVKSNEKSIMISVADGDKNSINKCETQAEKMEVDSQKSSIHASPVNDSSSVSQESDPMNIDDAIKDFTYDAESDSSDDLDCLAEEFAKADNLNDEGNKESKAALLLDSEDEIDSWIEDFKVVESDEDCIIVDDRNTAIIVNDDVNVSKPIISPKNVVESSRTYENKCNLNTHSNPCISEKSKDITDSHFINKTSSLNVPTLILSNTVEQKESNGTENVISEAENNNLYKKKDELFKNIVSGNHHDSNFNLHLVQGSCSNNIESKILEPALDPRLKEDSRNIESNSKSTISDDVKKRKVEETDSLLNGHPKKQREEIDIISSEKTNLPVKENSFDFIENTVITYQISQSLLDMWAKNLAVKFLNKAFEKEISDLRPLGKELKMKILTLREAYKDSSEKILQMTSDQHKRFTEHNFKSQDLSRTVGVNAKVSKPAAAPKTDVAKGILIPLQQGLRMTLPTVMPNLAISQQAYRPRLGPYRPRPPNVTVTGNATAPFSTVSRLSIPTSQSVASKPPSTTIQNTLLGKQLIDLTGDELASKNHILQTCQSSAASLQQSLSAKAQPSVPLGTASQQRNPCPPINEFIHNFSNINQGKSFVRNALNPDSRSRLFTPVPSALSSNKIAYIFPPSNQISMTAPRSNLTSIIPSASPRFQFMVRLPTTAPSLAVNRPTINSKGPCITSSQLNRALAPIQAQPLRHPAPLPQSPAYSSDISKGLLPPKPVLRGNQQRSGIVLTWSMSVFSTHATIKGYEIFAYQEGKEPINHTLWKMVGPVNALPLPMACTLTQFAPGHNYFFTVRAKDIHERYGPYSEPVNVFYTETNSQQ